VVCGDKFLDCIVFHSRPSKKYILISSPSRPSGMSADESRSTPVLAEAAPVGDDADSLDGEGQKAAVSRQGSTLGSLKQRAGGRLSVSLGGNGIYQVCEYYTVYPKPILSFSMDYENLAL
jgi:hypothetical protein